MPQIVHLSVKYSKPERMETTLWTVGRDRHFGQRGVAVDAGSDITAYSLDCKANSASWHLVPLKERLVSISGARNATMDPQQPDWRAAIFPEARTQSAQGDTVRSVVTPDDFASEAEAQLAAEKLIRKL
jgi:hypothetical protein